MMLSGLPLAVSAPVGLVIALMAVKGAHGQDAAADVSPELDLRDIINPKNDNIFRYLSPQLAHQTLIGIIYMSFWLGASGWDIVCSLTFDLRVIRETRYRSFFSVINSLAYLVSRYSTFIWLLRSLLDAISAIDDCPSRFNASAVLYGFVVCSTYIVFALRTANVWQMKLIIVIPLFAVVAGICGAAVALGRNMQVTRIGTSPFCSYTLKGTPSYILLCLCGLFDLLNFTFLGLKLSKSGWKGMLRCLLPQNRPNYDHAEIRQMLLQRTGLFTLAQLGLLTSVAILYAVFPDGQAIYKLMQVAAFHSITSNMNASIFRKAWRLTREQSPANCNVPPAYQPNWPSVPALGMPPGGDGDEMASASSARRFSREKALTQKAQDWTNAYVEGELVTDTVEKEQMSSVLPRHQADTMIGPGMELPSRAAVQEVGSSTDNIRFDTVLSQLSRGGALSEPNHEITPQLRSPGKSFSGLPSHHAAEGVPLPLRPSPGRSQTLFLGTSEAGPSTRGESSSSTSLATRALGRSAPGRELRVSTSDGLGASSRTGKEVDMRGTRPHTTPSPRVISGPVQVITPSPGSPRNMAHLQQQDPLLSPLPASLMQLVDSGMGKSCNNGPDVPKVGSHVSMIGQRSPQAGPFETGTQRPGVVEAPSINATDLLTPDSVKVAHSGTTLIDVNAARATAGPKDPSSPSRPKSASRAPTRSLIAVSRPTTAPGKDQRYPGYFGNTRPRAASGTNAWQRPLTSPFSAPTASTDLQRAFMDTIQSDELRMDRVGSSTDDGRPRTSRGGPVAPFGSREPIGSGARYARRPSLPHIPTSEPPTDVELLAAAARAATAFGSLPSRGGFSSVAEEVGRQPSSAIAEAYRELEEMAGRPSLSACSEASSSTTTTLSSTLNASHDTQS